MVKKVLVFIVSLLLVFSACDKKPLYLQGDAAVTVNVQTQVSIEAYWNTNIQSTLRYDWDTTLYGPIGYSKVDNVDLVIFNNKKIIERKTLNTGKRQLIDIELGNTYDFLIFNKTENTEDFYIDNKFLISTTTPGTKSVVEDVYYDLTNQPGEIFCVYQKNVFLSDDLSQYKEVYDHDKLIYVYDINTELKPVSYIYLIQFIIVKDDSLDIDVKGIPEYRITGVSSSKNLFTNTPVYTGKKEIRSTDIKPPQVVEDSLIFASKFTILNLGSDDEQSSWETPDNYIYNCLINIETEKSGSFNGIVNITDQLKKQPQGGIITIRINSSTLRRKDQDSGGINVDVEPWQEEEVQEIEI